MIIKIPQNNRFRQSNNGELRGSITRSFNMDFNEEEGKATQSRRMVPNTLVSNQAGLTTPTSFAYYDDRYFAIAGGTIYKNIGDSDGDIETRFTPDTDLNTPASTDEDNDIIAFNNKLYYIGSDIYEKSSTDTSDWVLVSTAPGAGFHSTTVYRNRLYYTDNADNIESMSDAEVVATSGQYTLDLGNSRLPITSIRAAENGIWIATTNKIGGRARMYFWDGDTADTVDAVYEIPDVSVKSLVIHEGRPYIVTGRGLIMVFNGSFFEEIDRFPFYSEIKKQYNRETRIDTWIHDNSIAIVDNQIHIAIANPPLDSTPLNDSDESYAGVWVLDSEVGLYHKYAFYTADQESSNASTQVDCHEIGALYPGAIGVNLSGWEEVGKFLCGVGYYSDATTETYGIFRVASKYEENTGGGTTFPDVSWFTTTQIQTEQIREVWQHVGLNFKPLTSGDKIVIKSRSKEIPYIDGTITWTSTTTFTTTDTDFATVKSNFDSGLDQEVTILRGLGGGMCSHITAITEAAGTYTVTVDETHTGATGTAKARVQRWDKRGVITSVTNGEDFAKFSVGDNSTWIQYKVFMIGSGKNVVVESLASISDSSVNF